MLTQAQKTMHSTSIEAAMMAKSAGAAKLLIGHYSARINNESSLFEEAKSVFPNTILAQEGVKIRI
jgi:ribonuclease Z